MPEINNKPSAQNSSLRSLLQSIEKMLNKYIGEGQGSNAVNERKQQVISALDDFTSRLKSPGTNKCPEGTQWDPITRTCKPIKQFGV